MSFETSQETRAKPIVAMITRLIRRQILQMGFVAGAPAPALAQVQDWRLAALRLRAAINRFSRFNGALKPDFAYGHLSREEFSLAHAFHIANHQDEIVVS